jgi:hypothetical protein
MKNIGIEKASLKIADVVTISLQKQKNQSVCIGKLNMIMR